MAGSWSSRSLTSKTGLPIPREKPPIIRPTDSNMLFRSPRITYGHPLLKLIVRPHHPNNVQKEICHAKADDHPRIKMSDSSSEIFSSSSGFCSL
jgi:hypothetical protein